MSVKIVMEFLGITGSLIICGSVIPQVIKTYRTKSARDLSITYLTTLMIGIILLTVYSIYIRDLVFIFGNVLSLLSVVILIGLWKMYYYKGLTGIKR
jgi:MtN3 and saliva related transmembrane protein